MTRPYAPPLAVAERALRLVFIRDLMLDALIGVHPIEKEQRQKLCINLNLAVVEHPSSLNDDINNVVCYDQIAVNTRHLVEDGHVNLVETLAERIAEMILADRRVRRVRVRIEKPQAIPGAAGAGVEIERAAS